MANLIESLRSPVVFDEIAKAVSDLPGRAGVPGLLPWARWSLCDRDAAEQDHQPEDDKPQDGGSGAATTDAVADPHDDHGPGGSQLRRSVASLLLALGCAVIAAATLLAIRLSRPNVGYVLADAGSAVVVLLVLLAIACRMRAVHVHTGTRPAAVPGPLASPRPPEVELPLIAAPPSDEVLASARWMMNAPLADEAFRQLSSPEQLVMLNGDPELPRLVRFAPASARPLIERAIDDDSISWIPAGDQLGVIRLVPMKAGLVRQRGA